ncbi:MAG: hypothetical protein JWR05_1177 [Mucilaginibacter sp.]|nr:hypothetical protein [Mucilaginibacter sp.]
MANILIYIIVHIYGIHLKCLFIAIGLITNRSYRTILINIIFFYQPFVPLEQNTWRPSQCLLIAIGLTHQSFLQNDTNKHYLFLLPFVPLEQNTKTNAITFNLLTPCYTPYILSPVFKDCFQKKKLCFRSSRHYC